jgi:UDP-N-acetylmuramate dehydrogenase
MDKRMNISSKKDFLEHIGQCGRVFENVSMSDFTSFACGGTADLLIIPNSAAALAAIQKELAPTGQSVTVIGGGSNLLVGDKGIRGIVVAVRETAGNAGIIENAGGLVYADALVQKSRFIDFCVQKGFGGMEFLAGIPGCIGGGIAMNAGTDKGTFSGILKRIVYARQNGALVTCDAPASGYRNFFLEEGIIAGAYFELSAADPSVTGKSVLGAIEQRKAKHPLEYPSAGSVFKNPPGEAAWKLIDKAGFKGRREGGAMVSEKHTNFIINIGAAKSSDIRSLIEMIQSAVMDKFSIKMEPEVKMIGEF